VDIYIFAGTVTGAMVNQGKRNSMTVREWNTKCWKDEDKWNG